MMIYRSFCFRKLCYHQRFMRNLCQKRCYSYEGDGKTTVTFLNREYDDLLTITGYSQAGFRLSSGLFVVGPVILFPKTLLSWNVANDDDINEDSLSLFYKLEPRVDLLVIGLGDDNSFRNQMQFVNKYNSLMKTKLNFELLTTEKAISTFNFLCIENRFVAAALIPPLKVDIKPQDAFVSHLQGKDDYFIGDDCDKDEEREKKLAKKFSENFPVEKKSVRSFFRSLVNEPQHNKKPKKDE